MPRKNIIPETFDSIIVGGGIVGAGLFREQSLHNVKVLIIDQADFNSQTSQGSSKMLHGGIRYLEQMDFFLVFEALKEKKIWLKLAPHITKEMPLYLPIYKHSKWPLIALKIGLFLYDLLSLFKNSPHKIFSRKNTLKAINGLKSDGLKGAGMYYDGIVDDSKLGLECIYDGLMSENSFALNYTKLINISKTDNDLYLLTTEDTLNGEKKTFKTKTVQFATGPFTDLAMKELNIEWDPVILASKGSHLWLSKSSLKIDNAMVLQTKDNRIIFVIPSRDSILVGTTEIPLTDDEEILNIKPTEDEINYLIDCLNEYFPDANISEKDVLSSFAAVRPLVKEGASRAKTSRKHKIFMPKENIFILVGGKYTTFRKMAEDLNKKIFKILDIKHDKTLTLKPLRTTSVIDTFVDKNIEQKDIETIIENELVRTKDDLLTRRLSLPSERHLSQKQKDQLSKIDMKDLN